MTEEWKNFSPPFEGYKISNYGRIISPRGKELKPYVQKCGNYYAVVCTLKIQRKNQYIRKIANVGVEVYRFFGKGYINGAKVVHKDGNKLNNCIDNLSICKGYTETPTEEQLARVPEIKACVKHCLKTLRLTRYERYGLDLNNVIGEAMLLIWLHLSQFNTKMSFYAFCKKYTIFAFLHEWKKWRKYGYVVSLDTNAEGGAL